MMNTARARKHSVQMTVTVPTCTREFITAYSSVAMGCAGVASEVCRILILGVSHMVCCAVCCKLKNHIRQACCATPSVGSNEASKAG